MDSSEIEGCLVYLGRSQETHVRSGAGRSFQAKKIARTRAES